MKTHIIHQRDEKKRKKRKENNKNKHYSAVDIVYCNSFLEVNKAKGKDKMKEKKKTNKDSDSMVIMMIVCIAQWLYDTILHYSNSTNCSDCGITRNR